MASEDQDERTEEATQTRREEFRNRGQVAHTRELATAFFLLFMGFGIFFLSRFYFQHMNEAMRYSMGSDMLTLLKSDNLLPALRFFSEKFLIMISPIILFSLLIGVGSSLIQIGFLNVENSITPDLNKINPMEGFKRIFSLKNAIEGFKSIIKILIFISILYLFLKSEVGKIPILNQYSITQLINYLGTLCVKLLGSIGFTVLALAGLDYFFLRWDLEKKMMMTKHEVREEHKSREGDPMIRSRMRRIQRDISQRRMMSKVPKADVIITNPTHIAVALRYDEQLPAPQLIAKGGDLVAEKIKEIARQHNIPIVENKPLARTIFKTMKLGQIIPRELFVAVAEVLSYVYRLKNKKITSQIDPLG